MQTSPTSVSLINHMGDDLSVVNAARVSFDKASECASDGNLFSRDQALIKYLAEHNHWSPFAHCFVSLRIKAPIFVARQLGKSQVGLSWNEVSRRYVDSDPEFYIPAEIHERPNNGIKQGSGDKHFLSSAFISSIAEATRLALHTYQRLIDSGVAPEEARMVLPQNTMTEWIWSGSLFAFARVCNLRLASDTQSATREVANDIAAFMAELFPCSWAALVKEVK